ncbi:MAG: hypothetical protein QM805_14130 [Pseudomonas sp.]
MRKTLLSLSTLAIGLLSADLALAACREAAQHLRQRVLPEHRICPGRPRAEQ